MKMKNLALLSVAASLFIAACAAGTSGVTSEQIGLRKVELTNDNIMLDDIKFTSAQAGESKLIERSFENAPPLISHTTEGMLPITKDMNNCLSCHDKAIAADVMATAAPATHYFDLRLNKSTGDKISDSRFNCTACHVEQSDAKPLVANKFEAKFSNDALKNKSNLIDTLNEGVN